MPSLAGLRNGRLGPGGRTAAGLNGDIARKAIDWEDKPAVASMIVKVFFLV
jgi:hypothetical protein